MGGRVRAEEEWNFQDWWLLELEAQEEASSPCSQGHQPFHQGAMRVQGQASLQDCPCLAHEEVEGDDQLSRLRFHFWFSGMLIPVGGRTGTDAFYARCKYHECGQSI